VTANACNLSPTEWIENYNLNDIDCSFYITGRLMAKPTILFGIILIALGLVAYLGTPVGTTTQRDDSSAPASDDAATAAPPKRSVTALIPAFVGIPLLLCGFLALNESRRKHAMHAAVMIGLLGALAGAGRGAMGLGKFFSGDPTLNQRAFLYVWAMAIICAVFVFLCVRSFIQVRKRRLADEAAV
jgi:hypothetical protein